jgi:hypothetical protein
LKHVFLILGLMLSAGSAWAALQDASEATSSGPSNFTTPGGSQALAGNLLSEMRLQWQQQDLCDSYGCIVIVNQTSSYRVTGFFVGERRRDGAVRWSSNQFGDALLPQRATYRYKSAKADCARPVRFTLRHRETKETLTIEQVADFCPTPKVHSLLRINVLRPEVFVE